MKTELTRLFTAKEIREHRASWRRFNHATELLRAKLAIDGHKRKKERERK